MTNVTSEEIAQVLWRFRAHDITAHGVERCSRREISEEEHADNVQDLLDHPEAVQAARDWLLTNPKEKGSSFHLKHVLENDTGRYVTNGSMIVAAILAERRITWSSGDAWCLVNPLIAAGPRAA